MKKKTFLLTTMLLVAMLIFTGCGNADDNQDPVAGDQSNPTLTQDMDNAADDVRDDVDDAADDIRDALDGDDNDDNDNVNKNNTDYKSTVGKRMTRVYYHLEDAGKQRLEELIEDYREVASAIEKIMQF